MPLVRGQKGGLGINNLERASAESSHLLHCFDPFVLIRARDGGNSVWSSHLMGKHCAVLDLEGRRAASLRSVAVGTRG